MTAAIAPAGRRHHHTQLTQSISTIDAMITGDVLMVSTIISSRPLML
jgi:hypothetical protein